MPREWELTDLIERVFGVAEDVGKFRKGLALRKQAAEERELTGREEESRWRFAPGGLEERVAGEQATTHRRLQDIMKPYYSGAAAQSYGAGRQAAAMGRGQELENLLTEGALPGLRKQEKARAGYTASVYEQLLEDLKGGKDVSLPNQQSTGESLWSYPDTPYRRRYREQWGR